VTECPFAESVKNGTRFRVATTVFPRSFVLQPNVSAAGRTLAIAVGDATSAWQSIADTAMRNAAIKIFGMADVNSVLPLVLVHRL